MAVAASPSPSMARLTSSASVDPARGEATTNKSGWEAWAVGILHHSRYVSPPRAHFSTPIEDFSGLHAPHEHTLPVERDARRVGEGRRRGVERIVVRFLVRGVVGFLTASLDFASFTGRSERAGRRRDTDFEVQIRPRTGK